MISFLSNNCNKYKNIKLDATPKIYNLSVNTAKFHKPTRVFIYGENFMPNGISILEFGNLNTPINYISSKIISFYVPFVGFPGSYNLIIKNNIILKATNVTGVSKTLTLDSNTRSFLIVE